MTYLPLLLLLCLAIYIPLAITLLCIDLWRNELSRYAISTRLAILVTIVQAAGLLFFASYMLSKGRF
jgi:type IV secretory pathway TrbL component